VGDDFEACWNCGTSSDRVPDPDFQRAEPLSDEHTVADARAAEPPSAEANSTDIRAKARDGSFKPRCPHCGSAQLYSRRIAAGRGEGPYLLAGLGGFLHYAEFDVVICARCGLTQLFAEPDAREKLRSSSDWKKV
jgi:hypothetical protein